MSNEFLAGSNRSRRYIIVGAVAATLMAGVIAGWAMRSEPNPEQHDAVSATTSPSASVSPQASGPLRLVPGERLVDGIRTGFPHSTAGAVSAAVEMWSQKGSTLDPVHAANVGRQMADSSWGDAEQRFAAGTRDARQQLGLTAEGPVPAGASMVLGPVAYQLREVSADRVTVFLLGYLTTSTPGGQLETKHSVFPTVLRWDGGDWKVSDPGNQSAILTGLVAKPGSPEAKALGWQEFLP